MMKPAEWALAAIVYGPPALAGLVTWALAGPAAGGAAALLTALAMVALAALLTRRQPRRPWPACRGGCPADGMARVDMGLLRCACGREYRVDGDLAKEVGTRDGELALARRRPDRSWGEWQVEP
jgi:hypothetical protein